jgi:hypothetical protein
MAFTVEDGTVVTGANAYITVAQYRTHHTDRGRAAADSDTGQGDTAVQAAIIQATDYVDKRFGRRFRGDRRTSSQELEWPRTDAWSDDGYTLGDIPKALVKGVAEYAWLQILLATDLAPLPDGTSGVVEQVTQKVGPITDSKKYAERPMVSSGNLVQSVKEYPQADMWIEELLVSYLSTEFHRG